MMPMARIHRLPRMGGLAFLRGNGLYIEGVEGEILEFCLGLVLSHRVKAMCTLFLFFHLFTLP